MSLRRTASIVAALSVGLLLNVTPAYAARDRTPPTTPTALRITATTPTSISLSWNASFDKGTFWYCVQQNGSGCYRVDATTAGYRPEDRAPEVLIRADRRTSP